MLSKFNSEKTEQLENLDKKVIFFEWEDYEQTICEKYKIQMPDKYRFSANSFNLEEAEGFDVICIREMSSISNSDLEALHENGVEEIAIRIAGFNMLDVDYANELGFKIYRVAAYSPESIAEYALSLMLALARKHNVQRRYQQQRLNERNIDSMGLLLKGRTLGLHGLGRIGSHLGKIANNGLGMNVQFFDPYVEYSPIANRVDSLEELYKSSDVVSIHVPLNEGTKGTVDSKLLTGLKDDFMLVNTARGGIFDKQAVLNALESGEIDYLGIDVWDKDDSFAEEFVGLDNVIQTFHVAFFTEEAVFNMVSETLDSVLGDVAEQNKLPIKY
jgi:D-lactate dehydrogenase